AYAPGRCVSEHRAKRRAPSVRRRRRMRAREVSKPNGRRIGSWASLSLSFFSYLLIGRLRDGDQVTLRAEEESSAGDGRRRHADLPDRVHGEELERRAGPDDVDVAFFARQVELPIRSDRRCREAGPARSQTFLIEPVAGLRLVAAQHAVVPANVEMIAVDQRS